MSVMERLFKPTVWENVSVMERLFKPTVWENVSVMERLFKPTVWENVSVRGEVNISYLSLQSCVWVI